MRTERSPTRRLPVILPSVADEILSSWIDRHAAFYGVPPLTMLRHSLPTISSLRSGDLHLTDEQAIHLGGSFAADPKIVREMSLARIAPALHRLIAAGPMQFCPNCASNSEEPAAATRIQYLGWRVTCPSCRTWLCDGASPDAPFSQYFGAALLGEKLFEVSHSNLGASVRSCPTAHDAAHSGRHKLRDTAGTISRSRCHHSRAGRYRCRQADIASIYSQTDPAAAFASGIACRRRDGGAHRTRHAGNAGDPHVGRKSKSLRQSRREDDWPTRRANADTAAVNVRMRPFHSHN